MREYSRKTLYGAPEVQGRLLLRVAAYWASCVLFVSIPILLSRVWADPSRLFYEHIPDLWHEYKHLAIPFGLLLPLALCDMLRYSNRLVGPIFRLRREMTALAMGKEVPQLTFRDDDEWKGLATAFNQLADELRRSRQGAVTPGDRGVNPRPFEHSPES